MWLETLQKMSSDLTFKAPATNAEIDQISVELGVQPPDELRSLLAESNGVDGEYGLGLLWDVARIIDDNQRFRSIPDFAELYMPFDCLLFFGDAGNGDQFAFAILSGSVRRADVFVWNHEDDSRSWVAPSLQAYFDWWLFGKLTVQGNQDG
jgi:hypothetical protein